MDTWPDIDKGVICGDCYALIKIKSYATCRTYCESIGLQCLSAFEEVKENCDIKSYHNCDTDFTTDPYPKTSDALCKCKANRKTIVRGGSYESNEDRTIEANRRTSMVAPPKGIVVYHV